MIAPSLFLWTKFKIWSLLTIHSILSDLYLAALEENQQIDLYRIQKQIKEQVRKDVDIATIERVLINLSKGDLIDYKDFGKWFTKINDPILNEFLKILGEIEVKYIRRNEVERDTVKKIYSCHKKVF